MRRPPRDVSSRTSASGSRLNDADDAASAAERACVKRFERCLGGLRRDDGDQLPLVGDVQRVDAEHLACAGDLRADGSACLVEHTASPHRARNSFSAAARPPRVGSRIQRTASPIRAVPPSVRSRGAVSLSMRPRVQVPARDMTAMPWSPSVPETSTRSPGRARSARRSTPAATSPTPGCVDEDAVGVARARRPSYRRSTIATPAASAARAMTAAIRRRSASGEPLLDDEAGARATAARRRRRRGR